MKKTTEGKKKDIKMLKVENSKNETYNFNQNEIQLILMWAYGYMDLSRFYPIDLDTKDNIATENFRRKLEQCFDGEYTIIEKSIKKDD